MLVPWRLYQASRPRTNPGTRPGEPDRITKLAETELRRQELFLLLLTSISPLLGATFLKYVLSALGERQSLSWFSTTLFVLATGIRPWTHFLGRIRGRTEALHDAIHYPPEKTDAADAKASAALLNRVDVLEEEVRELTASAAVAEPLQEVCDDLSEALGKLERDGKRSARKADATRLALLVRMAALEKGLVQVEQNRRMDIDALRRGYAPALYLRAWACVRMGVAAMLRLPMSIWNLGAPRRRCAVAGTRRCHCPSPRQYRAAFRPEARTAMSASGCLQAVPRTYRPFTNPLPRKRMMRMRRTTWIQMGRMSPRNRTPRLMARAVGARAGVAAVVAATVGEARLTASAQVLRSLLPSTSGCLCSLRRSSCGHTAPARVSCSQ